MPIFALPCTAKAFTAGSNPEYIAHAAANMTGSNRLLLGLGWSLVVLIGLAIAKKRTGRTVRELTLDSPYRVELGVPGDRLGRRVRHPRDRADPVAAGFALLGFFVFYLWKVCSSSPPR
nr:hypothetical protein [Amycolatopsis sp. NBRC 101858]